MNRARLDLPFTMVPNICFDEYMSELTPNEFQTYIFVIRKTVGWHKRSDEIALSQFKKFINSSIPTIRKAIKGLREKGFVKQVPSGKSYKYTILKPRFNFIDEEESDYFTERNLQGKVKEPFNEPCKNLTTQKKEQKIKLNTTTSKRSKFREDVPESEINTVIENWNKQFNTLIDRQSPAWVELIGKVLCYFKVYEIQKAMQNRLKSSFYLETKPGLLNNPKAFFPYLETIENDLGRKPSNIYTYEQKNHLITTKGYKDNNFTIRKDLIDAAGNPKWEYMGR